MRFLCFCLYVSETHLDLHVCAISFSFKDAMVIKDCQSKMSKMLRSFQSLLKFNFDSELKFIKENTISSMFCL